MATKGLQTRWGWGGAAHLQAHLQLAGVWCEHADALFCSRTPCGASDGSPDPADVFSKRGATRPHFAGAASALQPWESLRPLPAITRPHGGWAGG